MTKKKRATEHHIVPISRRGADESRNRMLLDENIHDAWHVLWGNLLVEEVICLIENLWAGKDGIMQEKYLVGEEVMKRRKLVDKRQSAWEIIFGKIRDAKTVAEIIRATFTKQLKGA